MKELLAKLKPSDLIGVQSHNCVGRTIRWCSTRSRRKLSPDAPNHLAQIIDSIPNGPLWAESSVTTQVPCVRCNQRKGVHFRLIAGRLREEMRRGSTIYRYRFIAHRSVITGKAFLEAERIALYDAWMAKHGQPYDYWGAYDARLRGAGRLLRLGLYKYIPDRAKNGKWFCNEAVLRCLQQVGRWPEDGNPSRWNPATAVADLLERGVVEQEMIWESDRLKEPDQLNRMRAKYDKAAKRY